MHVEMRAQKAKRAQHACTQEQLLTPQQKFIFSLIHIAPPPSQTNIHSFID
jgi:hypothetical protein